MNGQPRYSDEFRLLAIEDKMVGLIYSILEQACLVTEWPGPVADTERQAALEAFDEALAHAGEADRCPACGAAMTTGNGLCSDCLPIARRIECQSERDFATADTNAAAGIPTLLHGQVIRPGHPTTCPCTLCAGTVSTT